jgi:hypothetical protein
MNNYLLASYCFTFMSLAIVFIKITIDYRASRAEQKKK